VLILHDDGRVRGGPMAFLRLTIERLDPAALRVSLISLGGGQGVDDLRRHGIPVQVWPAGHGRQAWWTLRTAARLLSVVRRERVDLIVSNGTKEHLIGGTVAALAGLPCAWVSHLVWNPRLYYLRLAERVPAGAIIANSQTTWRALPARLQPRARVITFGPPPAATDGASHARAAALRARWGNPSAVLVCLGVFAPEKGQHWLLAAAPALVAQHPDLRIVLVGDDPRAAGARGPTYRDRLEALVRHGQLERNIVFHGYAEDVYPPLLAADVVVHTSLVPETFGFALVEAMQAGRPIVAADLGAQAELIQPGVTGVLVPPGDAAALAAAVNDLLRDRPRAAQLGAAGRERVAGHYTADRMAAEMQSLLLALIAESRRGRRSSTRGM
jgi:glycosyltransferase involved in cell wall biosynthesis